MESRDVIIIGSGPAGYTSAIYTSRAGYKPLIIQGMMQGGQLMITPEIENFPGFPDGLSGMDLMEKMKAQAEKFGTDVISGVVNKVDFKNSPYKISVDKNDYSANSVIIATGAEAKYLDIPKVHALKGKGVSACATCDGFFFKEKTVYVIGGGDTAAEEALFLTTYAKEVFVVHRRDELRTSKYLQDKLLNHPKITIIWDSVMEDIIESDKGTVGKIVLKNVKTKKTTEKDADGIFMGIGHSPATEIFKDQIDLDEKGYIKITDNVKTNVKGVFAAGDVMDPLYRQAVTAAGTGCMAALETDKYLQSIK